MFQQCNKRNKAEIRSTFIPRRCPLYWQPASDSLPHKNTCYPWICFICSAQGKVWRNRYRHPPCVCVSLLWAETLRYESPFYFCILRRRLRQRKRREELPILRPFLIFCAFLKIFLMSLNKLYWRREIKSRCIHEILSLRRKSRILTVTIHPRDRRVNNIATHESLHHAEERTPPPPPPVAWREHPKVAEGMETPVPFRRLGDQRSGEVVACTDRHSW